MKMKLFRVMFMATLLILFTTACSKDDEVSVPAAEAMAGSYAGNYTLTVMGQTSEEQATYSITKVNDTTISLTTPVAGEGAMALPSITLDNLPVSETTVSGTTAYMAKVSSFSGTVTVNGAEKNYTFSDVVVALSGNKIAINYSLQYGKMPMAMVFAFTGDKK